MKEYEITCGVGDELRWFGVEGIDEDDAISNLYANVDEKIDEIIEIREIKEQKKLQLIWETDSDEL